MTNFWQTTILAIFSLFLSSGLQAQDKNEGKPRFEWQPLEIRKSNFSQDLVMLDSERDEYASNLAAYAANEIAAKSASIDSLKQARRLIALAMHLSPRNKQAIVTQFQLSKGIVPEKTPTDYSPQVLARLLLTRGQLLLQQPEGENTVLAHYLIHLSAEIDPRNEDAVYSSELIRIDHGALDWDFLTEPVGNQNTNP